MKKRRLWLVPLSFGALPLVGLAAACSGGSGGSTGTTKRSQIKDSEYITQRVARTGSNSPFKAKEFSQDTSITYGSWQSRHYEATAASLIRKRIVGQPEIKKEFDRSTRQNSYKIHKPSVWSYKLEYAKSVIVTTKDGKVETFDKDDAQLLDTPKDGLYHEALVQGLSKDSKSINSQHFFETLKNATKLQFEVKKGTKWVDKEGKETKYEVVPEDFYISWMRTRFLGVKERQVEGKLKGVEVAKLDELLTNAADQGSTYFSEQLRYPNDYIFGLYDIDVAPISQKDKFIEDGKITFNKLATSQVGKFDLLFSHLTASQEFSAAPSQYIKEMVEKGTIPQLKSFKDSSVVDSSLINAIPKDSLLALAGTYWYGFNTENNLYAGGYYYAGYDQSTQEEKWVKNDHYVDQDWVKSDRSVREIRQRYFANGNEDQFKQTQWDDYLNGRIISIPYILVPDSDKSKVDSKGEEYGVKHLQSLNKNSLMFEQGWSFVPAFENLPEDFDPAKKESIDKLVGEASYNDAFAKLAYGKTLRELLEDKIKGYDALQTFYTGKTATRFRNLLSLAINFEYVSSFVSDGKQKMYLAGLAPDASWGGKDQLSASTKTPRDSYEELHKFSYLKEDGTWSESKGYSDYSQRSRTASSDLEKLKSPHFEALKKEMKKLLDDAGIKADEKVKWQQTFRWINWLPLKMETIYKLMPELYKELDPRLEAKFVKYERAQAADWRAQHIFGRSPFTIGGWGYDYDSAGSGFDGFSNTLKLSIPLAIIAQKSGDKYTQQQKDFAKSFPRIFKLSEELNKWVKEELDKKSFTLSIPFEKLSTLSLRELSEIHSEYHKYKLENGKLVHRTDSEIKSTDADLSSVTSRFFTTYISTLSNQEILELSKEITSYSGVTIGVLKSISLERFTPTLVNDHFIRPFTGPEQLWYMDIEVVQ
ncbi:hypothetical protein E1I18_00390 [Mycoplasmopsis mucosicanis]|uniref:Lipoprotein n=1 Tax=Mycoplasmopsis mucosicanis TaxID=458208 RepID=A0A507SR40_9BACT|nr:hypothetical protein [Mycoplasmopsis mucosicanis]TQC54220.1 hypothetical protein E1I18_00390 [Mycoplasmopsis mucosicanis]